MKIDPQIYYNEYGARLNTNPIEFPENLGSLLEKYYSLREPQNAFKTACFLFYKGLCLKDEYLSVSLALTSFVSSIETLIQYEYRNEDTKQCSECGQPQYQATPKFRTFLMTYGSQQKEFKKYANEIYDARSKILHRGQLLVSDLSPIKYLQDSRYLEYLIRTIRICLVNWLIKAN